VFASIISTEKISNDLKKICYAVFHRIFNHTFYGIIEKDASNKNQNI